MSVGLRSRIAEMDGIERIRKAIARGRCVPIVGAGVSVPVGCPTWSAYVRTLCDGLDVSPAVLKSFDAEQSIDVIEYLLSRRKSLGLPDQPVLGAIPSKLHKMLALWRCKLYVTTNFDDCMEKALIDEGGQVKVIYNDQFEKLDIESCLQPPSSRWSPVVIKLCSSSWHSNPGVLTREEFGSLMYGDRTAKELLKLLLRGGTCVFVGCGMGDPLINAAIDDCAASKLPVAHPVAIVPQSFSEVKRKSLERRGVCICHYSGETREQALAEKLESCTPYTFGHNRLLIFEPGSSSKLEQTLDALSRCRHALAISCVGLVTTSSLLAQVLESWARLNKPMVRAETFVVPRIDETEDVYSLVISRGVKWDAAFTPYEFATLNLSRFIEMYRSRVDQKLRGHHPGVALLSRNKTAFKSFVAGKAWAGGLLKSTRYFTLPLTIDNSAGEILDGILSREMEAEKVVIKPVDAAASIGVRLLDLGDRESCLSNIDALLRIIRAMPVSEETAECTTTTVQVEEFLSGEEFSVESRRSERSTEVLAIHWKVDIDGDASRFFERSFVVLPRAHRAYQVLERANHELLEGMKVGPGVFHAEFRMSGDFASVYPLEVGLRPGGGMVNYSVRSATGVDLYEAAIRCAFQAEPNVVLHNRTVSTGLIFSDADGGGVLPPICFQTDAGKDYVARRDVDSLRERLSRHLEMVPRSHAERRLCSVLNRDNEMCQLVREAFVTSSDALGLKAKIDLVQLWMDPGDLVYDEEAAYVGGLRIVADECLEGDAAVAEAVAAMQICLDSLSCKTLRPLQCFTWKSFKISGDFPEWWKEAKSGTFRSEVDSWTFSLEINELTKTGVKSVLDLGCGTAKPAIAIIDREIDYCGIDIQPGAIREARANLARRGTAVPPLLCHDVLADDLIEKLVQESGRRSWDAVVANLPYLPWPRDGVPPDPDVDGGEDGLKFIPSLIARIASEVSATFLVINVSSLCNLEEFAKKINDLGYRVRSVHATIAPLEEYALAVIEYLKSRPFVKIYGTPDEPKQIIYCFTLIKGRGITVDSTMKQAEYTIKPEEHAPNTVIQGHANW